MSSARALTGTSQVGSILSEVSQPPLQLEVSSEIPHPSDSAINFLTNLVEEDFTYLTFEDKLLSLSDDGKELGGYQMSVEKGRKDGQACFIIKANSSGYIDGVPCGTNITAYVTHKLETIEQTYHEYVKLDNHPLTRDTKLTRADSGFVVAKEIWQGDKSENISKSFDFGTMEGFISEGANLLLQRLLIVKPIPSYFEALSFDSDTNLCQVDYNTLGERIQRIGDEETQVIGLQRTIYSVTDLPTTWHTYHLRDGHLITRTQVGSPVTMRVLIVPELIEPDEHIQKPVFEKKPLDWEEDMQLYSRFLDRKEELRADHVLYLREHPEIKTLLADFLQHVLLRRPDDVVTVAANYFASFSSRLPAQSSYLKSAENTISELEELKKEN